MKRAVLIQAMIFLIFMLGLAGCSSTQSDTQFNTTIIKLPTPDSSHTVVTEPEFIKYSRPNLVANAQVLKDAGCSLSELSENNWTCQNNIQLSLLGCTEIYPDDLLAGLTPDFPVMRCSAGPHPIDKRGLYASGCMLTGYSGYIMFKDGRFQRITDVKDLRSTFAPIESEEEALSYAIAATNLIAVYWSGNHQSSQNYQYFLERYEESHVEVTSDGYVVNLFTMPTPLCGCLVHTTYLVKLLVTKDGEVQQLSAIEAYARESCID